MICDMKNFRDTLVHTYLYNLHASTYGLLCMLIAVPYVYIPIAYYAYVCSLLCLPIVSVVCIGDLYSLLHIPT